MQQTSAGRSPKDPGSGRARAPSPPTDGADAGRVARDYADVWRVEAPAGDLWTPRPWVPAAARHDEGRAER